VADGEGETFSYLLTQFGGGGFTVLNNGTHRQSVEPVFLGVVSSLVAVNSEFLKYLNTESTVLSLPKTVLSQLGWFSQPELSLSGMILS
jgi:hypothetical protein